MRRRQWNKLQKKGVIKELNQPEAIYLKKMRTKKKSIKITLKLPITGEPVYG